MGPRNAPIQRNNIYPVSQVQEPGRTRITKKIILSTYEPIFDYYGMTPEEKAPLECTRDRPLERISGGPPFGRNCTSCCRGSEEYEPDMVVKIKHVVSKGSHNIFVAMQKSLRSSISMIVQGYHPVYALGPFADPVARSFVSRRFDHPILSGLIY